MIHLTPQQLSSYMDGELNEVSTELVRRHMGICEECTLKFAALEEQEEHLSHALVHEPGDAFFDRFAADVERLLPSSASRRGSSSPASRAAAVREAAREAAKDAATPTASHAAEAATDPPVAVPKPVPAPALVEEGLPLGDESDLDADETLAALSVGRTMDEPPPRSRERKAPSVPPRARATQRPHQRQNIRRPAPSIPWYAALILAAIAGAAGVVASRTDPVSAWLDAHGLGSRSPNPERVAPADPGLQAPPPEQGAPTPDVPEPQTSDNSDATVDDFVEPHPPAAGGRGGEATGTRDPFAGLPPAPLAQVRAAQRSKAAADAQPSADRYDAAADEWERTIPLLRGARQQSLSRLELATSRYRAWESEPTASRASSAAVAIRAYLAFAPQGAPRDLVRNWLARVGH